MKRIKYICYYNYRDGKQRRENVQSASSKIDYIISVINQLGFGVDIISKTGVSRNDNALSFGGKINLGVNSVRHFFSFGLSKAPFLYIISRILNTIHFNVWLFFSLKHGEQIIVYHSLGYSMSLYLLKKIKGISIIGEVEEIYQDVHRQNGIISKYEYKFIESCNKYLFPTQLLDKKINKKKKPMAVIHGVYKSVEVTEPKFNDGKIHVVYGGTLDPQKGGGAAAATAAEYLPSNYHVHICGFGDSSLIKSLVKDVSEISEATLTFEGELKGLEYQRFIQKCDIGLSTQNPDADFNSTSFPSKILIYLSNGLKVLSVDIPVVKMSGVGDLVTYYEKQDAKSIAKGIIECQKNTNIDTKDIISKLDLDFQHNLSNLLSR